MKAILLTLMLAVSSPIWPLGPNPLPGDPFIIINKKTNQLSFFYEHQLVFQASVAIEKHVNDTPEGLFTVITKFVDPEYSKGKIRIPGKDHRNPLGTRWIGLDVRDTDGKYNGRAIVRHRTTWCKSIHL